MFVTRRPARSVFGPRQARLAALLNPWRGGQCVVALRCATGDAEGILVLGPEWHVRPTPQLLEGLEMLCGVGHVRLSYSPPPEPGSASSATVV